MAPIYALPSLLECEPHLLNHGKFAKTKTLTLVYYHSLNQELQQDFVGSSAADLFLFPDPIQDPTWGSGQAASSSPDPQP